MKIVIKNQPEVSGWYKSILPNQHLRLSGYTDRGYNRLFETPGCRVAKQILAVPVRRRLFDHNASNAARETCVIRGIFSVKRLHCCKSIIHDFINCFFN